MKLRPEEDFFDAIIRMLFVITSNKEKQAFNLITLGRINQPLTNGTKVD